MVKHYGTNNSKAWHSGECDASGQAGSGKHVWETVNHDNVRCLTKYKCTACGSTTSVDSSD